MSILCYHAVDPGWRSAMSVPPEAFETHCAWLARRRTVLPLDEAVGRLDRSFRLPRGLVALTFDDGYASLFEHAAPALRRHRLPWTVFLVAQTLTPGGRTVDWVDDPPSWPLETLSTAQVLELQDAGATFGSHSLAHRDLTAIPEDECERDLRESREVLEDLLGRPVPQLAYPRGRHDERVRRAARRAGFAHAFTLPEGPEPAGPFAVPRVGVYPGNRPAVLRVKTARWYQPVRTSRVFPTLRRLARR